MWKFLWQFYSAIQDWADWAAAEAVRLPDDLQPTAETQAWAMELFRAAADRPALLPAGSVAEGGSPVVADPLPHLDGARELGVGQQVALVELLGVDGIGRTM